VVVIFGQVAWKSVENTNEFSVAVVKRRAVFPGAGIRCCANGRHVDFGVLGDIHSLRKDDCPIFVFPSVRHNESLAAQVPGFKRRNRNPRAHSSLVNLLWFYCLPSIRAIREIRGFSKNPNFPRNLAQNFL
jgi:hypothetical protein